MRFRLSLVGVLSFCAALAPAHAQITIDTANATDWKIANGAISMDWDSTSGHVWSMYLKGYSTDLVDTGHCCTNGHPTGLYMDNDATGITGQGPAGVTPTASYSLVAGSYLDWWIVWPASASSPWGVSEHFLVQPNDPTLYVYTVVTHPASSGAAAWGQLQYVYRINQTEFNNTYQVNSGLNNLGATQIVLPSEADMGTTDPGRQVQNAVVDLNGFSLPSGFGRRFYTKYDYSSYQYLLQVNGNYGANFGAWSIVPSTESMAGGPTKQVEVYTENVLMGELLSGHLANAISYSEPAGANTTRVWGPIGFHFNALDSSHDTVAALYQDAVDAIPGAQALFNKDAQLIAYGYVPQGAGRGAVAANIAGGGSAAQYAAWTVLSDQFANMQYSVQGAQYWASNNAAGVATLGNVTPGTYRLSSYVLGEWGQLRADGVSVKAGATTDVNLTFTPENFSANGPLWTIGTPDRSAHEFLHGENNYGGAGSCAGCDDREYQGNWNYWSDFAATNGAVVYYATPVGSHPATNNPLAWNYIHWGQFDPNLYAGIYNASDDTTDGYQYILPKYAGSVGTTVPAWQVYFANTAAQAASGKCVDLSIGLAAAESDVFATLNGKQLVWHAKNQSDADVRSGLSGYYQWVVFEWPVSALAANGQNLLTLGVSGGGGNMYDALRMEISAQGANPSVTGWHDYEYIANGIDTPENPAAANNGKGTVVVQPNPSFTLTAAAAGVAVTQGGSAASAIAVTPWNGFSGNVQLTASGLPAGVAANFSANPASGTSVATFAAAGSAAPGSYTVTIAGASGALTASTTVVLTVNPAAVAGFGCHVSYAIEGQWQGGFGAALTIQNTGSAPISKWTLTWSFANGQTITEFWNGNATQSGSNVTVTNAGYNGTIPAGASYSQAGFNASWNNSANAVPTNFAVNGTACR